MNGMACSLWSLKQMRRMHGSTSIEWRECTYFPNIEPLLVLSLFHTSFSLVIHDSEIMSRQIHVHGSFKESCSIYNSVEVGTRTRTRQQCAV